MSSQQSDTALNNDSTNGETPVPYSSFRRRGPANVDYSELVKIPNPYRWPLILRNIGVTFNGVSCIMAPVKDDPLTRAKKIRVLPMREDDIILSAFPKCGTHWLSEMLDMLIKGTTQLGGTMKAGAMIDYTDDLDSLKDLPSPRFFNSHLTFAHLPEDVKRKKIKIVHIYRNLKDAAVSAYHHSKQYFEPGTEEFTFDNYLKGYNTEGYTSELHQWDWLKQMWEFQKAHPDHPIKHVCYASLKADPLSVLKNTCQFLGLNVTDELIRDVIEACSLQNMRSRAEKGSIKGANAINIYRKGIVGDWKNTFTVVQNEEFDACVKRKEDASDGFTLSNFEGIGV